MIDTIEPVINSDENRYKQILINLISNAIKFTQCGKIMIIIKTGTGGLFHVSVKDNGVGIPKGDLNLLFNVFGKLDSHASLNPNGVGLGLTISKALCEQLGGEIGVDSIENEGATFSFSLKDQTHLSNTRTERKNDELEESFNLLLKS